jgi:hypothetical protein
MQQLTDSNLSPQAPQKGFFRKFNSRCVKLIENNVAQQTFTTVKKITKNKVLDMNWIFLCFSAFLAGLEKTKTRVEVWGYKKKELASGKQKKNNYFVSLSGKSMVFFSLEKFISSIFSNCCPFVVFPTVCV